ncbi:hypothetical protein GCK32_010331 [Trichostrongylus colubriformis]|uniref:Uncharacterized protein n=1 Tax=Trichostrongylus colubriformis TaxID=6319 RepID=A0AAN8FGQ4_TRICO
MKSFEVESAAHNTFECMYVRKAQARAIKMFFGVEPEQVDEHIQARLLGYAVPGKKEERQGFSGLVVTTKSDRDSGNSVMQQDF